MADIFFDYFSYPLRVIAGSSTESLTYEPRMTMGQAIDVLALRHGDEFRRTMVSSGDGSRRVMLTVDGSTITSLAYELEPGNRVKCFVLSAAG